MSTTSAKALALALGLWTISVCADSPAPVPNVKLVFEEIDIPAPAPLTPAVAQTKVEPAKDHASKIDCSCHCNGHCDRPRAYARAEYLHWWLGDSSLPVLATTDDPNDARPGAFGFPATRAVLGGSDLDQDPFSGGRFTVGAWLRREPTVAAEATIFYLGEQTGEARVASSGAPGSVVLSRPFFDVTNGIENADPVALPLVQRGFVDASSRTELWGFEANLRKSMGCSSGLQVLAGFRFLDLDESLRITAAGQDLPAGAGNRVLVIDQFGARNRFYGGQLGVAGAWRLGHWLVDAQGKLALGCTDQQQTIAGFRSVEDQPTGAINTFPAGLLTQPTNTGQFSRNEFAVVPEVNLNLAYQFSQRLKVFVGYTLLYWSEVARPAGQIDRSINTTQFPPGNLTGPARPAGTSQSTDFWAHGANVGVEFRY